MKKIFTYMGLMAAALLTACSNDDIAQSSTKTSQIEEIAIDGNYITMPIALHEEDWDGNKIPSSKAQLYYDYSSGQATFNWVVEDIVGVYPVDKDNPGNSTIQSWKIWHVKQSGNKSIGIFDQDDEHIGHHEGSFIAVFPYITDDTDYRNIPITYLGQIQSASSKMHKYLIGKYEEYVNSEREAGSHLAKYDYLVDSERAATEESGKVRFDMKRLGAVTRFFIKVPAKIVFDSLQVYNSEKEFTLTTTLDASTGEYAAEPTRKSKVISLQLNKFGFDYWKSVAGDDNYYSETVGWTMQCYMMVAPIDLSEESTPTSTLYLIGREPHFYANAEEYNIAKGYGPSDPGYIADAAAYAALPASDKMKVYINVSAFNTAKGTSLTPAEFDELSTAQKMSEWTRKVYKADNLVKKNLQADGLYQWTVTGAGPDTPIEFQNITIQEWENGPGFTNADGNGTADW